jgi:hypothetical protein
VAHDLVLAQGDHLMQAAVLVRDEHQPQGRIQILNLRDGEGAYVLKNVVFNTHNAFERVPVYTVKILGDLG